MRAGLFDKLVERMDLLDPQSLQAYFLRLSKERGLLETIFQSIQEGVVVIDGQGQVTYANKAAETLIGLSLETGKGRPISRFFREVDWDRILNLDPSEWSKLSSHEMETQYPEHRFLSFYIVPLSVTDSLERGAVIILRDVTRDRQEESSLVESERINAIKLLAAGVAHEIGNPLNALTIHLQLLNREIARLPADKTEPLAELLGVARNEVSRLDMIITQFLQAIRPVHPNLATVNIQQLMEETLNLLKGEIQNRHIDVQLDIPEPLPEIPADRDQVKQAFFNLMKNSFQAMPDGGSLSVTLSASDQYLSAAFCDTGEGIEPENLGRVFDPYFTTKTKGSGLGLMIVQRIIHDHGGYIEVESKPGEGTTFTLFLPLADRRLGLLPRATDREPAGDQPLRGDA